jgi:hypothetical protein
MKLGGSALGRSAQVHRGLFAAVSALLLGGLGFWWLTAGNSSRETPAAFSLQTEAARMSPGVRERQSAASRPSGSKEQRGKTEPSHANVASQPTPMQEASARDDEAPDELRKPHAITPQHQRIFEENSRISAMNYAMDRGDFTALRRLNSEYRKDYPEDADVLKEGYDLIADCLEQRTPRAVAAARRFWQAERASGLRRYVRRHCLEGETPK